MLFRSLGYIKRTPLAEYRTQNRGGVGAKGSATRDEDFIEHIYMATMHNTMLFFTEKGRCYWLKVYEIPEGTRSSKGRAIQNVIQIEPDDKVRAYILSLIHISPVSDEPDESPFLEIPLTEEAPATVPEPAPSRPAGPRIVGGGEDFHTGTCCHTRHRELQSQ